MKILLFDIDGTLIDSGGAGKLAMESAMASIFGVTEIKQKIPYAGRTDKAISYDLMRGHGVDVTADNLERFLNSYLEHLPTCLKERPGKTLPGVVPLLQALTTRQDVCMGILTGNIAAGAARKLSHFQLNHYFGWGGFADNLSERNEVAKVARTVAQTQLGRPLGEDDSVWVIGDTPHDVTCARAIEANVLAVATGTHTVSQLSESRPDHVLADLTNLDEVLALWA